MAKAESSSIHRILSYPHPTTKGLGNSEAWFFRVVGQKVHQVLAATFKKAKNLEGILLGFAV